MPIRTFAALPQILAGALLLLPLASAAMPIQYGGDRAGFEAALSSIIIDDYSAPGYSAGDITNFGGFDILTDAAMNAVLGETRYRPLTSPNRNYVFSLGTEPLVYCAGCNGAFELDFTATSVGDATGVFGVGFDVMTRTLFHAIVTFGDDTTLDVPLASFSLNFWGITSETRIRSITLGMPAGQALIPGDSIQIDNLTIGRPAEVVAPVPEPAGLALVVMGVGVAGGLSRRRRRR